MAFISLNKSFKKAFYSLVNRVYLRCPSLVSDRLCLKTLFFLAFGYDLNLKDPKTFSEKLQWLKLYNRRPEYSQMVDKYAVKDYVANLIGEKYIIPTYGVWDRVEDIDWDSLPNSFVLKCTHDSGCVVICRDKSCFDRNAAIQKLKKALKRDYYLYGREWPYKNVPHRIIAEQYMTPEGTKELPDYKFSCFDGKVTDVMVCLGRSTGHTQYYFFDKSWRFLPLIYFGKDFPPDFTLPKPLCIDEMFDIASKLSKGLPYARVDMYAIGNHPYFGEITFFPQNGLDLDLLPETQRWYGSLLTLPSKTI